MKANRFVDAIRSPLRGFVVLIAALALLTAVLAPLFGPEDVSGTIALVYLLVTLLAAAIWGHLIGLLAAVASDIIVNFFFVAPRYTLNVREPAQAAQLAVFLAVAFIGASMLGLLRRQATLARSREAEANTVLGLTHAVVHSATPLEALEGLCEYVAQSLHADGCAIFGGTDDLRLIASSRNPGSQAPATRTEVAAAMESRQRNTAVHLGGRTRVFSRLPGRKPGAPVTIVAFPADALASGALRVTGRIEPPPLINASRLLSSFAAEASTALHRANLAEAAQEAEVLRRADQMKSALLSSVSHDLRSPLTAIKAAVDSLRDTSTNWTADDPDIAQLAARAEELGVRERVHLRGHVPYDKVPEVLSQATVALLPLPDEPVARLFTSPLKLFDYMAAGTAIVASDLPALREVLRHEENALLAAPGDPESFAAAVRRLIGDPTLAQRLGGQARADVNGYSWDARAEALLDFLAAPSSVRVAPR